MVVCHCTGLRERDLRRLVRAGHASPGQVARATGAGAACGGCRTIVRQLVACERERISAEREAPTPAGSSAEAPA